MVSKNIAIVLSLFVFLLTLNTVSAFDVETNIVTNAVCPSETIIIEDVVKATTSSSFEVMLSGNTDFVTVMPLSFTLDAGEQKSIYSYITPPSNALPGLYSFSLIIKNGQEQKTITHEFIVENCNELSLTLQNAETCACDTVQLEAEITNNGVYEQTYAIKAYPSIATPNVDKITLKPGQTETFYVSVKVPCTAKNNIKVTVQAESLQTYATAKAVATINVKQCYGYNVELQQDSFSICDGETLTIPVTITNLAEQPNYYELLLTGYKHASLSISELSIDAGQTRQFNINVMPPYLEEGNYTLKLQVLSDKGNIMTTKNIALTIRKCHSIAIDMPTTSDVLCNALTNTYAIYVTNTGEKPATISLSTDGVNFATLSNYSLQLDAGMQQAVTLTVSPPYETKPGTYNIKIKARDTVSNAQATATLQLETKSIEQCYMPRIYTNTDTIDIEQDKTATIMFTVENTGSNTASYDISIEGTATRFASLVPTLITLKPRQAEVVYVYVAPSIFTPVGSYTLTLNVRYNKTAMIASKTVNINVKPKSKKQQEQEIQTIEEVTETNQTVSIWQKIKNAFARFFSRFKIKKHEENEIEELLSEMESELNQPTVTSDVVSIEENEESNSNADVEAAEQLLPEAGQQEAQVAQQEASDIDELLSELETTQESSTNWENIMKQYKWYFVGILAAIIIAVILTATNSWKKIAKFFE